MTFKVILVVSIYAATVISMVDGIRCFQCNSANNSQCTNLEHYGNNRMIMPEVCKEYPNSAKAFCRKTVLKILDKTKQVEPRVIRSCGYIEYKKDCYNTDNDDHQERVCQCFQNDCNSASSLSSWNILMMTSITFCVLWNLYKFRID